MSRKKRTQIKAKQKQKKKKRRAKLKKKGFNPDDYFLDGIYVGLPR